MTKKERIEKIASAMCKVCDRHGWGPEDAFELDQFCNEFARAALEELPDEADGVGEPAVLRKGELLIRVFVSDYGVTMVEPLDGLIYAISDHALHTLPAWDIDKDSDEVVGAMVEKHGGRCVARRGKA